MGSKWEVFSVKLQFMEYIAYGKTYLGKGKLVLQFSPYYPFLKKRIKDKSRQKLIS